MNQVSYPGGISLSWCICIPHRTRSLWVVPLNVCGVRSISHCRIKVCSALRRRFVNWSSENTRPHSHSRLTATLNSRVMSPLLTLLAFAVGALLAAWTLVSHEQVGLPVLWATFRGVSTDASWGGNVQLPASCRTLRTSTYGKSVAGSLSRPQRATEAATMQTTVVPHRLAMHASDPTVQPSAAVTLDSGICWRSYLSVVFAAKCTLILLYWLSRSHWFVREANSTVCIPVVRRPRLEPEPDLDPRHQLFFGMPPRLQISEAPQPVIPHLQVRRVRLYDVDLCTGVVFQDPRRSESAIHFYFKAKVLVKPDSEVPAVDEVAQCIDKPIDQRKTECACSSRSAVKTSSRSISRWTF